MANAIIRRRMRKMAAARTAKEQVSTVVEEVKTAEVVAEPVVESVPETTPASEAVVEEPVKTVSKKKKSTTTLTE